MPPRKPKATGPTPVEALKHGDKRVNIPTSDAYDFVDEEVARPSQVRYERDPSLDPQLVWRGKDEQDSTDLFVTAPPIYIQEKIDPRVIIENLRETAAEGAPEPELALFDTFDGLEDWQTVEYYKHPANWSNRMILGDSLEVMASLAEKENLRGQVQMIYFDPPYGIKFGSNWQVSTRKRDVKDGKLEDATREVEQIKAFRDTWERGIHSYLSYLRDRLTVARDLLTESGSIFVQIGDANVHYVRALLDEVFGSENFVSLVSIKKTSVATTEYLAGTTDYVLWYAKDLVRLKYRELFRIRSVKAGGSAYDQIELRSGERRRLAIEERDQDLPDGARIFRLTTLTSEGQGRRKGEGAASWFPVRAGSRDFRPPANRRWSTNEDGMRRLMSARRVVVQGNNLAYVRYWNDFPVFPITNLWEDTQSGSSMDKLYVVQTNTKVIERCMLLATDPGDLVVDPTCGSGTTAVVAEQWGRRWITIDTSRVAVALARQRIMGAKLPYYLLADSPDGRAKEQELSGMPLPPAQTSGDVRKGFVYERVPHVTLKSIANNPDIKEGMSREEIDAAIARHAETELLYDRPYEDKRKIRVAGQFTVETLAPHRAVAPQQTRTRAEEQAVRGPGTATFEQTILDNLLKAGVQNGRTAERLKFDRVTPYAGRLIQAEGVRAGGDEKAPQRVAVSIGPQYGTVSPAWVKDAAREALRGEGFDLLLVCGFAFDARALETVEEFRSSEPGDFAVVQAQRTIGRLPILLVRMNADLAMGDSLLKKSASANLFTVFGEPDVRIEATPEGLIVEIIGVDVYNPTTGEFRSDDPSEIALWMIDTAYNEESFFVRHCYFTGGNIDPYTRLKKALKADIDEAAWASLYSTRSRPFPRPDTGKIAVKVINHYGDEVLQVYDV